MAGHDIGVILLQRGYPMKRLFNLRPLFVIILLSLMLTSIEGYAEKDDFYINIVKNSRLKNFNIGKTLDNYKYFKRKKWSYDLMTNINPALNQNLVTFTGVIDIDTYVKEKYISKEIIKKARKHFLNELHYRIFFVVNKDDSYSVMNSGIGAHYKKGPEWLDMWITDEGRDFPLFKAFARNELTMIIKDAIIKVANLKGPIEFQQLD